MSLTLQTEYQLLKICKMVDHETGNHHDDIIHLKILVFPISQNNIIKYCTYMLQDVIILGFPSITANHIHQQSQSTTKTMFFCKTHAVLLVEGQKLHKLCPISEARIKRFNMGI